MTEKRFQLENGLQIFLKENKYCKNIVRVQTIYNFGSNAETSKYRGCAHMLEHLIFKGTKELKVLHIKTLRMNIGDRLYNKLTKYMKNVSILEPVTKANIQNHELKAHYLHMLESNYDVKLFYDIHKEFSRDETRQLINSHYAKLMNAKNKNRKFQKVSTFEYLNQLKKCHLQSCDFIYDFYCKYQISNEIHDNAYIARIDFENFVKENVNPKLVTDVLTRAGALYLSEVDIDHIAREYGAQYNAFTNNTTTSYYFDVNKNVYHLFLQILATSCRNTGFNNEFINSEVGAIVQEMKHGEDSASRQGFYKMCEVMFPHDTSMHYSTIGDEKCLLSQTASKLKSFYNQLYQPKNCTLLITGDIDLLQAENNVRRYFSSISNSPESKKFEIEEKGFNLNRYEPKYHTLQSNVSSNRHIHSYPFMNNKINYHLGNALAIGMNERLQESLKNQLKLVTDVSAFAYQTSESGVFAIEFSATNESDVPQIESVIMDTIDNVWKNEEVEFIKNSLQVNNKLQNMDLSSYSSAFIDQLASTGNGDMNAVDVTVNGKNLECVNANQLSTLCSTFLDVMPTKICIVPSENTQKKDTILHAPTRVLPLQKPHSYEYFKDTDTTMFQKDDFYVKGINYDTSFEAARVQNPALQTIDFSLFDELHYDEDYNFSIDKVKCALLVDSFRDYYTRTIKDMANNGFFVNLGPTEVGFSYIINNEEKDSEKFNTFVQNFNLIVDFKLDEVNENEMVNIVNANKVAMIKNVQEMKQDPFTNCIHFCKQQYLNVNYSLDDMQSEIEQYDFKSQCNKMPFLDNYKKMSYSTPNQTTQIATVYELQTKDSVNKSQSIGGGNPQIPYLSTQKQKDTVRINLNIPNQSNRKQRTIMLARQCLFDQTSSYYRGCRPILEAIAFQGLGSRLYHIRETTGLFYSAHGKCGTFSGTKYPGFDYVTLQCFPDMTQKAISELNNLVSHQFWQLNPITTDELNAAKSLCLHQLFDLTNYNSINVKAIEVKNKYNEEFNEYMNQTYDAINGVKLEDINEFAAYFFQSKYEHLIVV